MSIIGKFLSDMTYKLTDYRRCGLLWYPVIFLSRNTIKVIDEPKNELEMLEMIIDYQEKEVERWEREGLI